MQINKASTILYQYQYQYQYQYECRSLCYSDSESISGLSGVEPISKYSRSVARTAWKRWGAQRAELFWIIRTKARMQALWYHSPRICTDFRGGIIAKRPQPARARAAERTDMPPVVHILNPGQVLHLQAATITHRKHIESTKAKAYNAMNQISD